MTQGASVKAQCLLKAPSEPLSSGATGGAFRRSCLSGHSPRVLRRPPVVSSARQSAAKQTTGSAGSPFLPTSLATQRSRAPAGARPGRCEAKHRKALGLHQRTTKQSVSSARSQPVGVGLRCANPTYGTGPHQRTLDPPPPAGHLKPGLQILPRTPPLLKPRAMFLLPAATLLRRTETLLPRRAMFLPPAPTLLLFGATLVVSSTNIATPPSNVSTRGSNDAAFLCNVAGCR